MQHRRANNRGGTYFFTVNLVDRSGDLLTRHIDTLRLVFRRVKERHPFHIDAIVVLPDHLHAIWTLPDGDADFAVRWALIKSGFSRALPLEEKIGASRESKGERGIWQRRYWEHQIRDDADMQRHVDYIHFNPVKHGHVERPSAWSYSSIHRYIERGVYDASWAAVPIGDEGEYGECAGVGE